MLNVPLHVVNLKSDFVSGSVTVEVMFSLPVSGVQGEEFSQLSKSQLI